MSERRIYNEEQKQAYIVFEGNNQDALTRYFKRIGPMEQSYKKDIADMTINELKSIIELLDIRREESRRHLISLLRGYCNWVKPSKEGTEINPINLINAESIDNVKATILQMIRNPKQVIEILETAMPSNNYHTLPNRYDRDKLLFWLLYTGLTFEEIQQLKKSDLTDKIVICNGREYETYKNVISLWEKVSNMTYIEKTGTKSKSGIINYELIDSDYLFRPITGRDVYREPVFKIGVFRAIIQNIFSAYLAEIENKVTISPRVKVSPGDIRISGIFYKLYLLENEGTEITSGILTDYLNLNCLKEQNLYMMTRKYSKDYKDWKNAFSYYVV